MEHSPFFAHISEAGQTQTIFSHLSGTASLAKAFAGAFGGEAQAELAGLAHDIGKYSEAFQRRLHGAPIGKGAKVQQSHRSREVRTETEPRFTGCQWAPFDHFPTDAFGFVYKLQIYKFLFVQICCRSPHGEHMMCPSGWDKKSTWPAPDIGTSHVLF